MPISPGLMPSHVPNLPPMFYGSLYDAYLWGISRHPGTFIVLSDFDPLPGDPTDAFRKMNLNANVFRPKRLVSMWAPNGRVVSRFVSDAPREVGVQDEGFWPRKVNLCGEERILGQDEWDLYKLSDRFECLVRSEPHLTAIAERALEPEPVRQESSRPSHKTPIRERNTRFKPPPSVQRRVSDEQKRKERGKRAHFPPPLDDLPSSSEDEDDDEEADEDEVMEMVDDSFTTTPKRYQKSETVKLSRAKMEEDRKKRRERNRQRRKMQEEDIGMGFAGPSNENYTSPNFDFSERARAKTMGPSTSQEHREAPNMKRKVDEREAESGGSDEDARTSKFYDKVGSSRRHRTMSPKSAKKSAQKLYNDRRRKRKEEINNRHKFRADHRVQTELQDLYANAKASLFGDNEQSHVPQSDDIDDLSMRDESFSSDEDSVDDESQEIDEEAIRRAALEESIRKIQELEKDRPLWEASARKRQAQEAEEHAQAEAKRKQRLAEEEAASQHKRDEAERKAREEAQRQRDAETARADVEHRRRTTRENILRKVNALKHQNRGRWSNQHAVNWYREKCDVFDKTKWRSADVVIAFESIPWPTTTCPGIFRPEDITWESTEEFFERARAQLVWDDYVKLVEKSTVRFHPDRWTARGVLSSIQDEREVERYKEAAVRAAKAITALWSKLKDR